MNTRNLIWIVAVMFLTAGCAGNSSSWHDDASARPGTDLPDHFLIATQTGTSEPNPDGACHTPMVDPRDGTSLSLIRSAEGRGDYEVPEGRYGVAKNQLLRLECATGRVVGIVKR